jgi:hypothetical protein
MRAADNTDEWPRCLLGGAIPCVSPAGHQWCRREMVTDEVRTSDDDGAGSPMERRGMMAAGEMEGRRYPVGLVVDRSGASSPLLLTGVQENTALILGTRAKG